MLSTLECRSSIGLEAERLRALEGLLCCNPQTKTGGVVPAVRSRGCRKLFHCRWCTASLALWSAWVDPRIINCQGCTAYIVVLLDSRDVWVELFEVQPGSQEEHTKREL